MNCISNISNAIMAIASVLNLIIVVLIFFKERRDIKNKEEYERKNNWYSSLGLRDLTISFSNKIETLKTDSLKFLANELKQTEYINLSKKVDDDFLRYKNEYLSIIDCIDGSIYNKLLLEFNQIQDDLYKIVSIMLGEKLLQGKRNVQAIIIQFDEIKKKIIKMTISIA